MVAYCQVGHFNHSLDLPLVFNLDKELLPLLINYSSNWIWRFTFKILQFEMHYINLSSLAYYSGTKTMYFKQMYHFIIEISFILVMAIAVFLS